MHLVNQKLPKMPVNESTLYKDRQLNQDSYCRQLVRSSNRTIYHMAVYLARYSSIKRFLHLRKLVCFSQLRQLFDGLHLELLRDLPCLQSRIFPTVAIPMPQFRPFFWYDHSPAVPLPNSGASSTSKLPSSLTLDARTHAHAHVHTCTHIE